MVINIQFTDTFRQIDAITYQINKSNPGDFQKVINSIFENNILLNTIIYYNDNSLLENITDSVTEHQLETGFYPLFKIIQVLIKI